jgi:GntR family transcriptional regulator
VNLTIDFRSGVPIYLQVVEQIKQMVLQGVLKPDDQLPTVRAMATELRINFNTVARAYRVLDEAGLISTQQGRGTYILEKPDEEALQYIRSQTLEELTRKFVDEAAKYGSTPQEILYIVHKELNRSPASSQARGLKNKEE